MMKAKVLFLCTGNSARSQMAEGYLRHVAGEDYEVMSAGTAPVGLNPLAVEVMREIGIDISRQTSKNVSQFLGANIPYVITVCDRARESCPIFPGAFRLLHWSFDDPAAVEGPGEEKLAAFRRVRDQIAASIDRQFLNRPLLHEDR
ncbi:MAG: arsenate reductase ArsC [Actinomycetota bacterium]